MPSFYEFFAGGGMARAGLGDGWECLLANDIDPKKGSSYAANWGSKDLKIIDVGALQTTDLPGHADLAWASFPCQDLSLAGNCAGLQGKQSGTFWLFWRLVEALGHQLRQPRVIVLENVCGAITSHGGEDFAAIASALQAEGYRFGALVIDAVRFLPQSRPRLFIVAVHNSQVIPETITRLQPDPQWHAANLIGAYRKLPKIVRAAWIWWNLPSPPVHGATFSDLIENEPHGVKWHSNEETRRLLSMMSALNLKKVEQAKKMGRRMVGGVYKRTRLDQAGQRLQRTEVRFDDVAGCLRTPTGGSSRQSVLIVEGERVRSRLLSPREAARLMGLPESYQIPENYNEAYHLAGDGVAVPVVRFLAAHILEPILGETRQPAKEAA